MVTLESNPAALTSFPIPASLDAACLSFRYPTGKFPEVSMGKKHKPLPAWPLSTPPTFFLSYPEFVETYCSQEGQTLESQSLQAGEG